MLDATIDLARFWVKKALGVAVTVGLRKALVDSTSHADDIMCWAET